MDHIKKLFFQSIDQTIKNTEETILSGTLDSYSDYKKLTGFLNGLRESRVQFEEIWAKLTQENDAL